MTESNKGFICTDLVGEAVTQLTADFAQRKSYRIRAVYVAQNHNTEELSVVLENVKTGELLIDWLSRYAVERS